MKAEHKHHVKIQMRANILIRETSPRPSLPQCYSPSTAPALEDVARARQMWATLYIIAAMIELSLKLEAPSWFTNVPSSRSQPQREHPPVRMREEEHLTHSITTPTIGDLRRNPRRSNLPNERSSARAWWISTAMTSLTANQGSSISQHLRAIKEILQDVTRQMKYVQSLDW